MSSGPSSIAAHPSSSAEKATGTGWRGLNMPDASPALKRLYAADGDPRGRLLVSEMLRGNAGSWPAVDQWGVAGFELLGSALCIRRAFVGRDRALMARLVPFVLGVALMSWSTGDLVLSISGGSASATPLLANIFYLGFYPLTYVGVMLAVHLERAA